MNGTTNKPYANTYLELISHTDNGAPHYESKDLGTTHTDSNGYFTKKYTQTDITGGSAHMTLEGTSIKFDVPVNQNVSKEFYISSMGKLKIYLQSSIPLNKDTLFFGYGLGNNYHTDTVFQDLQGYYKTMNLSTGTTIIGWGRGVNQYLNGYYPNNRRQLTITGDPVVDSVTISY